jgi:hypothetical protein
MKIWSKYLHIYIKNRTMKPVEIILRWRREYEGRDRVGEFD